MAVVAGVATAIGVSIATAEVIVAVGSVAAGVGLNLLASELAPSANTPTTAGETGIKQETEIGGRVARSLLLGEDCVTAGQLIALDTNEGDDRYLNYVFLVSDYLTTALKEIFADDKKLNLKAGNNSSNDNKGRAISSFDKDGEEYGYVRFYDGRQTSSDQWLRSHLKGWGAGDILKGCSYVCVTLRYNRKVFESYPQFRFVIDGAPLYDPRKDDTAPGGSGSHRFGNISTHEFSANPTVINYNIMRGFSVEELPFYGLQGVAEEDIPLAEFTAAADRCDEFVARKSGGDERRYRAGGEVTVDTPVGDALEAFNAAMDGEIVEDGGLFKMYAGGVSAPIMDLTDADLIDDADDEGRNGVPFREHINGVVATFLDPAQDFVEAALPSRLSDVQQELDGGQLLTIDLDLSKVRSPTQGQRLMEAVRRRALMTRTHRRTFHPRAYKARVGNTIRLSSERYGYTNKLFQVRRAGYDSACCATFELRETDGTIWDWDPATDEIDKDGENVDPEPISPKSVAGFTVTATRELGANGNELGLQLLWTPPDHRKIVAVRAEWRRFGQTRKRRVRSGDPEDGLLDIIGGVQSSTQYEARLQYELDNGDFGPWTNWQSVTTPGRIPNTSLVPSLTTVEAGISAQQNGERASAYLKLGWANPSEPSIREVEFWFREKQSDDNFAEWQEERSKNLDGRTIRIEKSVRPSTLYQVQPRFRYQDGEPGPFGLVYEVTTPAAFDPNLAPVPAIALTAIRARGKTKEDIKVGLQLTYTKASMRYPTESSPVDPRIVDVEFAYQRQLEDNSWSAFKFVRAGNTDDLDNFITEVFDNVRRNTPHRAKARFVFEREKRGNFSALTSSVTTLDDIFPNADLPTAVIMGGTDLVSVQRENAAGVKVPVIRGVIEAVNDPRIRSVEIAYRLTSDAGNWSRLLFTQDNDEGGWNGTKDDRRFQLDVALVPDASYTLRPRFVLENGRMAPRGATINIVTAGEVRKVTAADLTGDLAASRIIVGGGARKLSENLNSDGRLKNDGLADDAVDDVKIANVKRGKVYVDSAAAGARTLANIFDASGKLKGDEMVARSVDRASLADKSTADIGYAFNDNQTLVGSERTKLLEVTVAVRKGSKVELAGCVSIRNVDGTGTCVVNIDVMRVMPGSGQSNDVRVERFPSLGGENYRISHAYLCVDQPPGSMFPGGDEDALLSIVYELYADGTGTGGDTAQINARSMKATNLRQAT